MLSRNNNHRVCLLMMDLNAFKQINGIQIDGSGLAIGIHSHRCGIDDDIGVMVKGYCFLIGDNPVSSSSADR